MAIFDVFRSLTMAEGSQFTFDLNDQIVSAAGLDPAHYQRITVSWQTQSGSAQLGPDFTVSDAGGNPNFAGSADITTADIPLTLRTIDDGSGEPDETFRITATVTATFVPGRFGPNGENFNQINFFLDGTIIERLQPVISFDHGALRIDESLRSVTYTLSRSFVPINDTGSSVQVRAIDGHATFGVDYGFPQPFTVTFGPGQRTATFPVGIIDDTLVELNENFLLILENPQNAQIGIGEAQTTIMDNDGPVDLPANTSTPARITPGTSATGTLGTVGDRDWFGIQLFAGVPYTIRLEGSPTGAGTLSDTYLRLYDGAGVLLSEDDDAGVGLNSQLVFVPTVSGLYFIAAGSFDDSLTGTYTINITLPAVAPTITSGGGGNSATISVPENVKVATTVVAIDANPGTNLVYSIVGGVDQARFQINATTGVLTFVAPPDFETPADSDHNNSYVVQVRASDGSLIDTQVITINVFDLNEKPPSDFNADSKGDILFQHDNGALGIWLMDGVNVATFSGAIQHPGAGWHAKDSGDFNADGKADILWQHDDGTAAVWLFDGFNPIAFGPALSNPGAAWHVIAAADFNANGKADIFWQHDNGAIGIWLMDGVNVAQFSPAIPHPGAGWHAKDAADFSGDGKADILWQHDNGTPAVWLADGINITAFGPALSNPGPAWHIIAAADFDANGKADILWQHDNGALGVWLMDGVNVAQFSPAIPHPGAGWHAQNAVDTNGDGKADIIWQHDNGTPAVWLMNGVAPTAFGPALSNPGSPWDII